MSEPFRIPGDALELLRYENQALKDELFHVRRENQWLEMEHDTMMADYTNLYKRTKGLEKDWHNAAAVILGLLLGVALSFGLSFLQVHVLKGVNVPWL